MESECFLVTALDYLLLSTKNLKQSIEFSISHN